MGNLLLVVEDEDNLRKMLTSYLAAEGFSTLEARDGLQALALWKEAKPDLIILDIMLPGKTGLDVLRDIRAVDDTPVIMLTARVEEIDKLLGLEMGADDYITKPFSPRELTARIKAVLRRVVNRGDKTGLALGSLVLDIQRFEAIINGQPLALTSTEFKILLMLTENPGQVFSRLQILERVYGDIYEGYERTIDTHINNLRRKMEAFPALTWRIKTVYGVGYKLAE
ncbi:MAG: response regulator transcription factor [Deltaproteobacteria bacterium]